MTADLDALVAFVRARLDEKSAAAERALRFRYDHPSDAPWERARLAIAHGAPFSSDPHIALNSPAQVLREVDAHRRIMDRAALADPDSVLGLAAWLDLVDLAAPHSSHPDYREEWAPHA